MPLRDHAILRSYAWRAVATLSLIVSGACSDGPTQVENRTQLTLLQPPSMSAHSAEPLHRQPIVQVTDASGNAIARGGVQVTAQLQSGVGQLSNATTTTDSEGRATFTALTMTGANGTYTLQFKAAGVATGVSAAVVISDPLCAAGTGLPLDLPLGGTERFVVADGNAPRCLEFHAPRNNGEQYLIMFENLPRTGDFSAGMFPGPQSSFDFALKVNAGPVQPVVSAATSAMRAARMTSHTADAGNAEHVREWDFGAGAIYEGNPATPPAGTSLMAQPVSSGSGSAQRASLMSAVPAVGDTIQVYLAGIPRLGIPDGVQRAVVRFVSNELVFADDIRLETTLLRPNGAHNTPLTVPQMDSIAREYASYARVQGDMFFQGRQNNATEASRTTVISTLMFSDNVWGYTFSAGNYFAFDYWVSTDGSTRGLNQLPQRVADDLFMHEISHMRHYGMLEHALPIRVTKRGNQWLTEGFARFMERLPIAMRLTGNPAPSRTSNFVLARNPVFNNAYFYDDVPTYLDAGSPLFDGYSAASFIFDYIADQVALQGRDYIAAVRDVVLNGGVEADLNAAIGRWLPGMTFPEIVTRARIALYMDDYAPDLPAWTQYHQYQLRGSRPPGTRSSKDPRNAWPAIVPGATFTDTRTLQNGTAFGYLVDGTTGTVSTRISLEPTTGQNGVMSITRIR